MKIVQLNSDKKGSFKAFDGEAIAGELLYTWVGKEKLILEHTEVGDRYLGLGIGKQLVLEAVRFARENSIKIIPLCPYAKALFDKLPEIKDVLF